MGGELHCYICNHEASTGIILLNHYICRACEEDLLETPNDQLKYQMFKRKLKEIWKGTAIEV
ncbi:MAG: sigma factor G inhibitor Gin [Clostridiaceae bacterium]|nr:sigma factor G inhibitor Gin [Clostridiaceae bacterium]